MAELRRRGHSAYLVGGCVRDLLMGRAPKDFDVATSARPDEVVRMFPGSGLVGAHFGVVLVRNGSEQVEVATYRSDHDYRDGRHPDLVLFETNPQADVERRDFTINALLMDPESGEVLDFVGGRDDLRAGVVRTVGDPRRRFAEDHLRMLRAVRFAARFGFALDPATLAAIRELRSAVRAVSAERVNGELSRILTEGGGRRGVGLLEESGLLGEILPEVVPLAAVTLDMLGLMERPTVTLAMAVLLRSSTAPDDIMARFRYSNDEIARVAALVANRRRFKDVAMMSQGELKRFLRMDGFDEHLELHRLECAASGDSLGTWMLVSAKLRETPTEALWPPRLVTGDDLVAEGLKPGPEFKRLLEMVETAQLNGCVSDREGALALVRREVHCG